MDLNAIKAQQQAVQQTVPASADVASLDTTDTAKEEVSQKVIEAKNPTAEEMQALCQNIKTSYNFNVDVKPVKFNFKKQVDKETGIETVRQPLELAIPFPSFEGIVAILEAGGKQLELLQDAIEGVITQTAREIISEDHNINASNFPTEKLSWEAIANMPKAQRRGGGIPKETWEEFSADYIAVMQSATGKSLEQVTNAAKILVNRLSTAKTNKDVLNFLVGQLSIYAEKSPNAEEFQEVVAFLLDKAETYLNLTQEDLLQNL